jgi:hypothetical protein
MSLRMRTVLCLVLVGAVWAGEVLFAEAVRPAQTTRLAIDALNGVEQHAARLRTYERFEDAATVCAGVLSIGIVVACFTRRGKGLS